jgi:hypothetical protein
MVEIRNRWIQYVACVSLLAMSQSLGQTTGEIKANPAQSAPTQPAPSQSGPAQSYLKEAAISESTGTIHIAANSPRPLEQVLDALQKKYGWVVNYEDPQFMSKPDVVATPAAGEHNAASNVPARMPGGGAFSVEFPADAPEEGKILQIVVDAYNRSDNPGRFELRSSKEGAFFVVGTQARDARGQISHQRAVFDAPITVVRGEKMASDTVNLICKKVTALRGVAVTVAISPRKVMNYTAVTVGGTNVPARDLLLQTLTATHKNLYWRLLFDPVTKGYFLDIHLTKPS